MSDQQEQDQDSEEDSECKDVLLDEAIKLLVRFTTGYKMSDKCECVTCAAGKFLNEII